MLSNIPDEKLDEGLHRIIDELMRNTHICARELAIAHGVSTSRLSAEEKVIIEDVFEQLRERLLYRLMQCSDLRVKCGAEWDNIAVRMPKKVIGTFKLVPLEDVSS